MNLQVNHVDFDVVPLEIQSRLCLSPTLGVNQANFGATPSRNLSRLGFSPTPVVKKEDFGYGPFENPSSFGISSTQVVNPADSSASPSENPATKACGRPLGAGTKQHLETLGFLVKISTVVDVVSHLLNFPEAIERLGILLRSNESSENKGNIPVDILDTPKEYIFHMDVPGLSK
ncbi:hypothetical protein BC332_20646 [Capsicum chinense]|nr:hypothetical protein BC332_20646 [Capsicum chinense]